MARMVVPQWAMDLKSQLDRIERKLDALTNDLTEDISEGAVATPNSADTAMITVLYDKLARVEQLPAKAYLTAGDGRANDDLSRWLVRGTLERGATRITAATAGRPSALQFLFMSESGKSWMVPEWALGEIREHGFLIRADVATKLLRNEIAWLKVGRPAFKSDDNPGGWTHDSHEHREDSPFYVGG